MEKEMRGDESNGTELVLAKEGVGESHRAASSGASAERNERKEELTLVSVESRLLNTEAARVR